MTNNNRIVNGLWIGNELNSIEQLCIQSFIQNGHIFYLWTYSEIINLPNGTILKDANEIIPKNEVFSYVNTNKFGHGKGSYAGFSDIFRYKLLFEYGGWWTDMDITCLKPLDFPQKYVFRKNGNKGIVGNLMKCTAKSELMQYCYKNAEQQINQNNKDWMLPIKILNNGIELFHLEEFILDFTNEDSWSIISRLLTSNYNIDKHWFAIHWMNEEWRRHSLSKNVYIKNTKIEKLLTKYLIAHETFPKKSSIIIKLKLSKWNYRYINIKARINWILMDFLK